MAERGERAHGRGRGEGLGGRGRGGNHEVLPNSLPCEASFMYE